MKAIKTKYLGPTNTKPSRVKATDEDGNSVVLSIGAEGAAKTMDKAALELCRKMDWPGELIRGSLSDGYVYVFDAPSARVSVEG